MRKAIGDPAYPLQSMFPQVQSIPVVAGTARLSRIDRIRVLFTAVVVIMAGIGCATIEDSAGGTDVELSAPDQARADLKSLAESERGQDASGPGIEVAVPPGVDPAAVTAPQLHRERQNVPLTEAMREVSRMRPQPVDRAPDAAEPDIQQKIDAQRHYAAGREAMLLNRYLMAVTRFERALESDPTAAVIIRHLARSYDALGNTSRAAETYRRLLRLQPSDSEALLALARNDFNQGDFEQAAAMLAPLFLHGADPSLDSAARAFADYLVGISLRRLGFDKAAIEALGACLAGLNAADPSSPYYSQVELIERRRAEIQREIGDAFCRLQEFDEALKAYEAALRLPSVDELSIRARVVYANLALGRINSAHLAYLDAISDDAADLDDRAIRLADYIRSADAESHLLGAAVRGLHKENPESTELARIVAALLPFQEGVDALRTIIDRNPSDGEAVRQLLDWAARQGPSSAAEVTMLLLRDHPQQAMLYSDMLARAIGASPQVLASLDADDPHAALIRSRLLLTAGALGPAWHANERGIVHFDGQSADRSGSEPDGPIEQALLINRIELAAALDEIGLLEKAIESVERFDNVESWIVRSRANQTIGATEEAIEAAEQSVALDSRNAQAWIELARARLMMPDLATEAEAAANRAIEIDPHADEAYELLLRLYGSGGALESAAQLRATIQALAQSHPASRLYALLRADELAGRGRHETALAELLNLYETRPGDGEVLTRITSNWLARADVEAARIWIQSVLRERPDDPQLLREWVRIMLQSGRVEEAEQMLRERLARHPDDAVAPLLLEGVVRTAGREVDAARLARARLNNRPPGSSRSLELAQLLISQGDISGALTELGTLLEHFDQLPEQVTGRFLRNVLEIDSKDAPVESFRLAVLERFLNRYPDAPLSVYGAALMSLARLEEADRFDEVAGRMFHAAAAKNVSMEEDVRTLRDVVQILIEIARPGYAARLMALRMETGRPIDPQLLGFVAQVAQATFLAADRVDDAIAVIERLEREGRIGLLPWSAQAANPGAEARYALGVFATMMGKIEAANRLYLDAIGRQPDHGMALNNLGYQRLEDGSDDEETRRLIGRAYELLPDSSSVLDTYGWLLYKEGRLEDDPQTAAPGAVTLIDRALQTSSADPAQETSPEVWDHLGDAKWRVGDHAGAVAAWKEAVRVGEDAGYRQRTIEAYRRYQQRIWGLLLKDPQAVFEQTQGMILAAARNKLEQARRHEAPALAPTFAELEQAARRNETQRNAESHRE